MKVSGSNEEIPSADNVVFQIVCGCVEVGRHVRRGGDFPLFHCAEHGHHFHDAADVDGERATLLDISFPLASPERTKSREKSRLNSSFCPSVR